jgi:hypothetical protein
MPEIGTSGSMSGDGKRSVGHRPQAAAPVLDSTRPEAEVACATASEGNQVARFRSRGREAPTGWFHLNRRDFAAAALNFDVDWPYLMFVRWDHCAE